MTRNQSLVEYQNLLTGWFFSFKISGHVASCYHTKMISTSDKAKFPNMEHHEFHPGNARGLARELVAAAVGNYSNRIPGKDIYLLNRFY